MDGGERGAMCDAGSERVAAARVETRISELFSRAYLSRASGSLGLGQISSCSEFGVLLVPYGMVSHILSYLLYEAAASSVPNLRVPEGCWIGDKYVLFK